MRADTLAIYASRSGSEWASLGRPKESYGRRGLTNVDRVVSSESDPRLVEIVTNTTELASMVQDLERAAALNPPNFSSDIELQAAKKDCDNALRSVALVRDRLMVMSDMDLVLWARLSICAMNVNAERGVRGADLIFDEMHRRGIVDAYRLVYGRFLVSCPGRELQSLEWLDKCMGQGVDGEVRYLRAWAKIWTSNVDGAVAELRDGQDPQQIALLEAIRRGRELIEARSRFLDETKSAPRK